MKQDETDEQIAQRAAGEIRNAPNATAAYACVPEVILRALQAQRKQFEARMETFNATQVKLGLAYNQAIKRAETAEARLASAVEQCAEAIPTTWLDSLLTGPDAVIGKGPYTGSDIETLLYAIKQRIRALTNDAPENP